MFKKIGKVLIVILLTGFAGFFGWWVGKNYGSGKNALPINIAQPRAFDKYTIENLAKADIQPGKLEIEKIMEEKENFTSYLFKLSFNPTLRGNSPQDIKSTSGQINFPSGLEVPPADKFPIIVMLRGYMDQKLYKTGDGTKNAAEYFAENGYITIAPDFLGYAGSSEEAENIFETRFQTYTTALSLIESLDQVGRWDGENIFFWAHSNGGQIALTVLEITEKTIPTSLWAPVSKPFPYSILYYTDESDDRGKLIRSELAKFEDLYDTDKYSLTQYFDKIHAPIQIHQGTADEAVPVDWSDNLSQTLLNLDLDLEYFTYTGADHNLHPSWDTVVTRDLEFFNNYLK